MKILVSFFLFLLPLGIGLSGEALAMPLETEIKTLLASHGKKYSFSLRNSEGKEIFNVNGDLPLAPASIAKTVSTGCSLNLLGPQFQFETLFGMRGKLEGDTLIGDLVIQGSGDPSFVIEDLREVIEKLRYVHGIKKITGNLIFDVGFFGVESLKMADGFEGDNGRSFAAELTAFAINQNSFSFWVTPDHRPTESMPSGSTRAITLPAQVLNLRLTNKTKVGPGNSVAVSYNPEAQTASLTGKIESDAEPKGIYRSVENPYQYYTKMIQRLWLNSGGEWPKLKSMIETQPVKMTLLWNHRSRPLSKILMDVNKLSLNMGAELILLTAGAKQSLRPATPEKSLAFLKSCLKDFGIAENQIILTNASGLSREALIKTSALTQILFQMQKKPYFAEYLASLSLLGIDGTTKSRLIPYAGRGRLKTGSIRGVRSIAGLLYTKSWDPLTFALIVNGVNPNDPQVKKTEDKILEKILLTY